MEKRKKKRSITESGSLQQSSSSSQRSDEVSSPRNVCDYTPSVPMVIGRKSDPPFIVAIWKCIFNLKKKDVRTSVAAVKAEMHKKFRHFSKVFDSNLRNACIEKLVAERKINGVTVLELPGEEDAVLTHEMNCYACFLNGEEMWKCDGCHRVYHASCYNYCDIKGKCFYCEPHIQQIVRGRTLTAVDVNDLLSIMYYKIGLQNGYLDVINSSSFFEEKKTIGHLLPKLLFRHHITNSLIKRKLENNEYKSIKECVRDYRQMVYNVCCIYGINSHSAKRAQEMYNFIQSEASYMHNCFDCYVYYAQDKRRDTQNIWFLMPCNPPHEIVFAKYKDFEPGPAKIIRSDKDQAYVWFFGDHEVAWVHKANTSPCLTVKEPISHKLKMAVIEMEKYKLIISRYKNGKIDFKGIPRLRREAESLPDNDSG